MKTATRMKPKPGKWHYRRSPCSRCVCEYICARNTGKVRRCDRQHPEMPPVAKP